MPKNKPLTITLYSTIALALVLLGAYYLVFMFMARMHAHTTTVLQDISGATGEESSLLAMKKVLETDTSLFDRITGSVVPADGNIAFIEDVEREARAQNVEVTIDSLNVEQNDALAKAGLQYFVVSMKFVGSWQGATRFVSALEALPVAVKISRYGIMNTTDNPTAPGATKLGPQTWQGVLEFRVLQHSTNT